jgi:hypothetical protein
MTDARPFPEIPGFTIRAVLGRGATATVDRRRRPSANRRDSVALKVADVGGVEGRPPRAAVVPPPKRGRRARSNISLIARGIERGRDGARFCWFAMELI